MAGKILKLWLDMAAVLEVKGNALLRFGTPHTTIYILHSLCTTLICDSDNAHNSKYGYKWQANTCGAQQSTPRSARSTELAVQEQQDARLGM